MARAQYQVLVIPYYMENDSVQYCIFERRDMGIWQFIAGGGEDEDASILASAQREAFEEAGIDKENRFDRLQTQCSIPAFCFKGATSWGDDCFVIPEYAFAVRVTERKIERSDEHTAYKWVNYEEALRRLHYDSNKTALWELDARIKRRLLH